MFSGAGFRPDFIFSKGRENGTPKKVLYPLLDIETAVPNGTLYASSKEREKSAWGSPAIPPPSGLAALRSRHLVAPIGKMIIRFLSREYIRINLWLTGTGRIVKQFEFEAS